MCQLYRRTRFVYCSLSKYVVTLPCNEIASLSWVHTSDPEGMYAVSVEALTALTAGPLANCYKYASWLLHWLGFI
jgi:hypothetical protein